MIMKHIKHIDSFLNESISISQVKKAFDKAEKKLGAGSSAEEIANFISSEFNVKNRYEDILDVITSTEEDETFNAILSVLNENVLNEAARIGSSSWSSILRDLKYDGWDIEGNSAYKSYEGDGGDERKLELSNYGDDEVEWTIYDGRGKEINSGSFDAEGLSAGELDGEVWSNINESTVNEGRTIEKIEKDRTKVVNDMAKMAIKWSAAKQSGNKEAEADLLQTLKDLTAQKKELEIELIQAIAGKDRDVELVISESNMSEIDLLAREAKNFKDFIKAFKTDNRYKGLDTAGDVKEFEDWLKSIYDNAKNESMNEAEDVKKGIHDHWKELYNEDFISTYPKVAKILKNRQNVDRRELARIWEETYGEDFKEKYAKIWDVLD